jgi:nucleoside-diphosphate-sugar epimerase
MSNFKGTFEIKLKIRFNFRLAGVYGPGEQIILGRSVKLIRVGIARDTFSSKENLLIDFVHIKNVVQAHIKVIGKCSNTLKDCL